VQSYSGTDASVYVTVRYGEDGQTSSKLLLDNENTNDREWNQIDIYKGEVLRGFTKGMDIKQAQQFRDYLDYWEDSKTIQVVVELLAGGTVAPAWNVDLFKMYFNGVNGENVVVRCHVGDYWFYDGDSKPFDCVKMAPRNPKNSIQKIQTHTCDIRDAGADTYMQIRLCHDREDFQDFERNAQDYKKCCETNNFRLYSYQNTYFDIDEQISEGKLDGGEELGACEGFELSGNHVWAEFLNHGGDSACWDEMRFFGSQEDNNSNDTDDGSILQMAFKSCDFNPVEFDSDEARTLYGDTWTDWYAHEKIKCDFSTSTNTITKIVIQICNSKNSGTSEKVQLRLKNDDLEECTTEGLDVNEEGVLVEFTPRQFGEDCKKFKVTETTKIWVSNTKGRDDFCLSYLSLDTVNNGRTKIIGCKYAMNEHYNLMVLGEETEIPLICT